MKETEKMDKYVNFANELSKLGKMKVPGAPVVMKALGTVAKCLGKRLQEMKIREKASTMQTTALILRKVLEYYSFLCKPDGNTQ